MKSVFFAGIQKKIIRRPAPTRQRPPAPGVVAENQSGVEHVLTLAPR
jgi:hypothetical protein